VFTRAAAEPTEQGRISLLCDFFFDSSALTASDPFSAEYVSQVLELYAAISGNSEYAPVTRERAPYVTEPSVDLVAHPPPYASGGSDFLGEFMIAMGFLMRVLAAPKESSILEYGPGAGVLAVALACNGHDVSVVDVEPAYIDGITERCARLGVPITTHVGLFGERPEASKQYDTVLFFESFHHCLHHNDLLRDLHDVVAAGGRIVMAGEPIIEAGSYWEPTIPFAWGPRCDLLSLRAMRTHGWMELGFREDYFFEAARRALWRTTKYECSLTGRGTTYVLQRHDEV
jgi:2-polyprenyl-3-methyl-5-hydroxy-6-metoxy-1,4-benzoquinol methylase